MRQPPERGLAALPLPFAARYALYSSCVSWPSALASASVNAFARLCTDAASVTLSVPFLSVSRSDQFIFFGAAADSGVADSCAVDCDFDHASPDCAASPCVPVGCSVADCVADCAACWACASVDCVVACAACCACASADCGVVLCAKASGAARVSARAR